MLRDNGGAQWVTVTTVLRFHNVWGRAYFAVEIIDMLTITVKIVLGRSDPATIGFAVPVLLFCAFYLLAARAVLGQGRAAGALA